MTELDRILAANAGAPASVHDAPPPAQPLRGLVIVTCMDARLDLFGRLGVAVGDAHLLRNAGGRVTDDVVRSLALSTQLFGSREIGVIHHLDCGLQGRANDDLVRATGVDIDFLPFDDIDASVIGDVERIRALPWLPADALVWGGVLSVHDGSLRTVAPPDGPLPTRTG